MFTPWEGRFWGRPENALAGRKILLLGESHHAAEQDGALVGTTEADGTLKTFEEWVLGDKAHAFFTKLLQTVVGRKKRGMTAEEISAARDSVVIRPFNCSLLSSLHSELAHSTVIVLAPSELARVAETAPARLIRALPARHSPR